MSVLLPAGTGENGSRNFWPADTTFLILPLSNDSFNLKTNAKSADAFYESLEKIVNELKSSVRPLLSLEPTLALSEMTDADS